MVRLLPLDGALAVDMFEDQAALGVVERDGRTPIRPTNESFSILGILGRSGDEVPPEARNAAAAGGKSRTSFGASPGPAHL
jgi:hypothetical protein